MPFWGVGFQEGDGHDCGYVEVGGPQYVFSFAHYFGDLPDDSTLVGVTVNKNGLHGFR